MNLLDRKTRSSSEPRVPRLTPKRTTDAIKVSFLERDLAVAEDRAQEAKAACEKARTEAISAMAHNPSGAKPDTSVAERVFAERARGAEYLRAALELAQRRLADQQAKGPSVEELLQLEGDMLGSLAEFNAAARAELAAQTRLEDVRDRAVRMLGTDHPICDWPIGIDAIEGVMGARWVLETAAKIGALIQAQAAQPASNPAPAPSGNSALEEIERLKADDEFQAAFWSGNKAAKAKWASLHQAAYPEGS